MRVGGSSATSEAGREGSEKASRSVQPQGFPRQDTPVESASSQGSFPKSYVEASGERATLARESIYVIRGNVQDIMQRVLSLKSEGMKLETSSSTRC